MKQECKDCNKSLEDCTCLEDTIELPNQALIDAAKNHSNQTIRDDSEKSFIEGAEWQQEQDQIVYLNGYVDGSREQAKLMYNEEDLECAWSSSEQNMRFQFSSSAYKGITFKQWLEKFKEEDREKE
jgi:hypothetical protein